MSLQMMTPTAHEKAEWSRLAQAAYGAMRNDIGHLYSTSASLPRDARLPITDFDFLQAGYRYWLMFNAFWPVGGALGD